MTHDHIDERYACGQDLAIWAYLPYERSNTVIKRLGAQLEGMLRQDRILYDGCVRNAYIYSIIDKEWNEVKVHLEELLSRSYQEM